MQFQDEKTWEEHWKKNFESDRFEWFRFYGKLQFDDNIGTKDMLLDALEGEDLSGRDFSQQNLSGQKLNGKNLRGARFSRTRLRYADLRGSDLKGAVLDMTDLAGSYLQAADLRSIRYDVVRSGKKMLLSTIGGSYYNSQTLGLSQKQKVMMYDVDNPPACKGANMAGHNFQNKDIKAVNFRYANLMQSKMIKLTFPIPGFKEQHRNVNFKGPDFQSTCLQGAYLSELLNLKRAQFQNSDLRYAYIHRSKLEEAQFQKVNLQNVYIYRSEFQKANFQDANLQNAKLWGVDLRAANLKGADFRGAFFYDVNFEGALIDERTLGLEQVSFTTTPEAE